MRPGFPKDSDLSTLAKERVRFLTKPFTLEDLQSKLSELWSRHCGT